MRRLLDDQHWQVALADEAFGGRAGHQAPHEAGAPCPQDHQVGALRRGVPENSGNQRAGDDVGWD
jgi:hypothetical protein